MMTNWMVSTWVLGALMLSEVMGPGVVRMARDRLPARVSNAYVVGIVATSFVLWPIFVALTVVSIMRARR